MTIPSGLYPKLLTTDMYGMPQATNLTNWKGVNRKLTAIWPDASLAYYQQNLRMRVHGELQRRSGMAQGNIAKQSSAVYNMVPLSAPAGPYTIVITPGSVYSYPSPKANFVDTIGFPPIIDAGSCVIYGPYLFSGTGSTMSSQNLPAELSCPGTVLVSGFEASQQGQGQMPTPYGYQFVISAGPNVIINSACLVNQSASAPIPAGTTSIAWDVTGGCSGGSTPGTWSVIITCP